MTASRIRDGGVPRRSTKSKKSSIQQEAAETATKEAEDADNDDENGKIFAEVDLIKKNPSFIESDTDGEKARTLIFFFCAYVVCCCTEKSLQK